MVEEERWGGRGGGGGFLGVVGLEGEGFLGSGLCTCFTLFKFLLVENKCFFIEMIVFFELKGLYRFFSI